MTRPDRRPAADEGGMAMMMVIGFMLVAGVIVATALSYATSLQPRAVNGQDRVEALSAAQAGIDHYLAHLNQDRNYYATADCDNPALKGPNADPALLSAPCGWDANTPVGWVKVQPDDPASAEFHYDIDSRQMDQFTIWVSSTGRAGNVVRTLQAKVTIAGSQRYLYVTDFEDADPENSVIYPNGAPHDHCGKSGTTPAKYWWSPSASTNQRLKNAPNQYCTEIQFIAADVLDGPVHFNDTPLVNGNATFKQGFTTYSTGCPKSATSDASVAKAAGCYRGSGSPSLSSKGARWGNVNLLPDTTGDIVNKPGCQFTGDTRIRFNSNGTMDVWNTMSAGTTVAFAGNPAVATAPNCGTEANYKPQSGQKYPAAKQTVNVPDGMVIYVRKAANSATCVAGQIVNGTTSGSDAKDVIPTRSTSIANAVSDIGFLHPVYTKTRTGGVWPSTPTVLSSSHSTKFDCGLGNVYIEGTVKGRVTIAAENNVVVTGDLGIANTALGDATGKDDSDIVGLVAQNSVVVYHPVEVTSWSVEATANKGQTKPDCKSKPSDTPTGTSAGASCKYTPKDWDNLDYLSPPKNAADGKKHRWIYASIQTLAHSFWVESYNKGDPTGILSVRGSIAQRWRGIVGTGSISTGYIKDYSYDKRLQTTSPPYFPPWANGDWAAETTGELPTPDSIK